jgi:aminodeoxyfutalosine synthase
VREKKSGNKVYFNHNFHVEPTNVCVYSCSFCSYSRLIKHREQGWELSVDQILDIVKGYDNQDVTEVHITGGVVPRQDLAFYTELFRKIKAHRPGLHIKALTPVEFHYIFKKAKVTYEEGLKMMKEAGLDSLPGGGAEIFDQKIRDEIAGGKCSAEEWLSIHEIWHKMGNHSNATMLYGHIETFAHRVDHMERLRSLQDRTGGFNAFIPLKFRNKDNQMSHVPEVSVIEDLRNYAMARIYLDNFPHIKAYWAMIGRNTAQLSLNFGTDDLDGTIDDTTKIYSMAGSEEQNPKLSTQQLVDLIKAVGKTPVQRDTLYNVVKEYPV